MSPSKLSEFANRVTSIMAVIMREFGKKSMRGSLLHKVTIPQLVVLENLNFHGETKMKDLAGFAAVTTAAMTGLIDRLVRDGYAQRIYDSGDRRIIKVKITSKGQKLLKNINEEKRRILIKIFDKFSQKDRDDYLRILLQIKDILTSSKDEIKDNK
ncbi:MAG: MarR family transcriptional regulator [Candidatus Omnitrophica bacterium]|nr:MarR family transcriptional regulator [Candidatus Omnitrophota bacterium]